MDSYDGSPFFDLPGFDGFKFKIESTRGVDHPPGTLPEIDASGYVNSGAVNLHGTLPLCPYCGGDLI